MKNYFWVGVWLICAQFCAVIPATAQDDAGIEPNLVELEFLATTAPQQALSLADRALAALQNAASPDPQQVYSLFRLKADLLLELGRNEEAAMLISALAGHAARHRAVLELDPVDLHREAADLFKKLGDNRSALLQLKAILEEQRDGGRASKILAETLRELAELSTMADLPGDADNYNEAADIALAPAYSGTRGTDEGYREVEVYYATDRARSGKATPSRFYGYQRGPLELGIAVVTIPDTHQPGVVEVPSIWKLEFGPSATKHVVLKSVTPVAQNDFYTSMQQKFATRTSKEAFVFIHGYNVGFAKAARRAAQLAYDMDYSGIPVLYSWPSRGSAIGYMADAAVVRLSGRRLSLFLDDLVARSGAETVHIIGHSMGNRALTDALELMALRHNLNQSSEPIFGQVLFAAPDVDAGLFVEMVKAIRPIAKRLTLYASEEDWALQSSKKLHGNAPRAGQGGDATLVDLNVDSVDMSKLGDDMLAHSYFANDSSALADILTLFWRNTAPERRCGLVASETGQAGAPPLWKYELGRCASNNLIGVLAHMRRENVTTPTQVRSVLSRTAESPDLISQLEPVIIKLLAE